MKRETVICPECGISITVNNIKKHINSKACFKNRNIKINQRKKEITSITQINESWKQPNESTNVHTVERNIQKKVFLHIFGDHMVKEKIMIQT